VVHTSSGRRGVDVRTLDLDALRSVDVDVDGSGLPLSSAPVTGPPRNAHELKGKRGLRRLVAAFRYSFEGLAAAWRHEDAFRVEVVTAALLLPVAVLLPVGAVERVLLVGTLLLMLIVELVNSAVEAAIDRIGSEIHPLSKRAKDLASAAVLLSLLLAGFVWISIVAEWWIG
jgi:diacylglycerol kinase (ATP)